MVPGLFAPVRNRLGTRGETVPPACLLLLSGPVESFVRRASAAWHTSTNRWNDDYADFADHRGSLLVAATLHSPGREPSAVILPNREIVVPTVTSPNDLGASAARSSHPLAPSSSTLVHRDERGVQSLWLGVSVSSSTDCHDGRMLRTTADNPGRQRPAGTDQQQGPGARH